MVTNVLCLFMPCAEQGFHGIGIVVGEQGGHIHDELGRGHVVHDPSLHFRRGLQKRFFQFLEWVCWFRHALIFYFMIFLHNLGLGPLQPHFNGTLPYIQQFCQILDGGIVLVFEQ